MDAHDMTLLWHFIDKWAALKPDAEALVFEDTRLTWAQFKEQAGRTAKAFLELGIEKGDRVAMVAMGRPEFLISFMAAAKVGAIWLGLSPKFTVDELRYLLADCRPTVLIALREYMGIDLVQQGLTFRQEFPCINEVLVIGEAVETLLPYRDFVDRPRPELDAALEQRAAEVSDEDEVLLMYTSGSTGKPKGVLQTHRSIVTNIAVEAKYFGWEGETRALLHFPINHVAADVEIGFGAIYAGAAVILMDRFDPQAALETIEKERVTVIGQVPVMYLMQFQAPKFADMDWSHVKSFIWGGSAAPQILLDGLAAIAERTGARLITGYGSTELCGFATYTMPEDSLELLAKSVGKIVPPYELKIVDKNRETLPAGQVGEMAVRGSIVMKGYLNNPTATAEAIDDEGWYYTSDLGWMDDNGYIFIAGRSSEMFKSGGENVFPREVEDVLESHPAVLFAAVIGVPHELYDEVGRAFIMLKPGQNTTEDDLRTYCKAHLANFKVPRDYDLRPELPLLPNGKVNKVALKEELGLR